MSTTSTDLTVTLDEGRCSGHGRCANAAPDLYVLDEDGYCAIDVLTVGADRRADAERGAEACPESALALS